MMAAAIPAYSSYGLSQELHELAEQPVAGSLVLRQLAHEAGYLSSQGSVVLQWRSPCDPQPDDLSNRVKLVYQVSHIPGWNVAGRFSWSAEPLGEAGAALRQLMAEGGRLSGQGELRYGGLLQTRMALPALALAADGETLQMAPSQGSLVIGKTALQFDWTLDHLVQRSAGSALEAKQVHLVLDLDNRTLGTGSFALSAQQLDTSLLALQGVALHSETRSTGERLRASVSQTAQSARFVGQTLQDLKLEFSATDLHAPSLQQLAALYAQSCGLRTLTDPASQQWRAALRTLLASGFSVGVSSLQGRSAQGSLDASMVLQLLPASGGTVALARQLQSSGQLRIQGDLLAPEHRQVALDTGWLQETSGGLLARYDYTQGVLQLGAATQDSSLFNGVLARTDVVLQSFLQGTGAWTPRGFAVDEMNGPNAPAVASDEALPVLPK